MGSHNDSARCAEDWRSFGPKMRETASFPSPGGFWRVLCELFLAFFGAPSGVSGNLRGTFGDLRGTFGDLRGPSGAVSGNLRGPSGTFGGVSGNFRGTFGDLRGRFGVVQRSKSGFVRGSVRLIGRNSPK